jgi:hypothetical protein
MLSGLFSNFWVTRFKAWTLGARRFLLSLEKEFKDGHKEDLSMSRLINVKKSESKAKVHSSDERIRS